MKNAVRPELGTPGNIASTWDPLTNQSARRYEPAPPEHTWELAHPADVAVFQEMRRSDGQIMSLLKALRLPIQSAAWALDTEGCRDEVVEFVRTNLGLDAPGERRQRRRRNGVVWTDHVREALLMLPFGHVFFEQVYAYRRDDNRVYLRKLALRLPTTIRRIVLARDGGLEGIVQNPPEGYVDADLDLHGIFIPVDRLVGYVLDREGADWTGNALALDTPVPTPDGWTTMGDLQVGDRVFSDTGKTCRVTGKSQVWESRPTYRVEFTSGEVIYADENHLWTVRSWKDRNSSSARRREATQTLTTKEMAEAVELPGKNVRRNWAIDSPGPLEYQKADLLIDPYVLGYWLGDGHSRAATITTMDADVINEFERRGYPTTLRKGTENNVASSYGVGNDLQLKLRVSGLLQNKHVPEDYLRGSYQQRLDLLRGLCDSDGNVGGKKCQRGEFVNTNKRLAEAVVELIRSLGGKANVFHNRSAGKQTVMKSGQVVNHVSDVYRVDFALPDTPFNVARKAERYDADRRRPRDKFIVKSIERVEDRDTVCIEVDSPSHLYLVGEQLVPTHNSILRTAYKNWLIRDVLMKVDAQSVERNGMGIPTFAYDPATPGAREEAERIVEEVRAGECAGVVYPVSETGASDAFRLVGVSGNVVDAVPRMKYHDQQISRSALAMVLDLGHDAGARSLGETFQSLFTNALQAIAEDVAAVATEHIIRDLVEINYGADEPYPVLTPGRLRDNEEITLDALASLAGAGIITPDSGLEEHVRKRTGLPESDPRGPAPVAPAQPFQASEGQQTVLERFEALAQRMADLHRGH